MSTPDWEAIQHNALAAASATVVGGTTVYAQAPMVPMALGLFGGGGGEANHGQQLPHQRGHAQGQNPNKPIYPPPNCIEEAGTPVPVNSLNSKLAMN